MEQTKVFGEAVPSELEKIEAMKSIITLHGRKPVDEVKVGLQELVSDIEKLFNPAARAPMRRTGSRKFNPKTMSSPEAER